MLLNAATVTLKISGPVAGAIIALAGVLVGLWVSGDRAERQRRRDLHARSLAAILAYAEMPFMIRRRRHEPEHASAERVRLAAQFSTVKAELTTCEVLLAADSDQQLAAAYHTLVEVARRTAGQEAHNAWNSKPITTDTEMNMGDLFNRVGDLRTQLDIFQRDLARATLPRRIRARRRMKGSGTAGASPGGT